MIHTILEELNESNSSNYKLSVLKKYSDNELLKRVLKMTYDKVIFNYYVSMNHWIKTYGKEIVSGGLLDFLETKEEKYTLEEVLDFIEFKLATREITGNASIDALDNYFQHMNEKDLNLIIKLIGRDLKINCGKTQINKVFPNLIVDPVYMRCETFSKKHSKHIKFPAFIQLKADGTYREMKVEEGTCEFISRGGESYKYDFSEQFKHLPAGHYTGEMIVKGTKDRSESNGLLNSDNVPMNDVVFYVWDYISLEEYKNATNKIKNSTPYKDRFNALKNIVIGLDHPQLQLIESYEVNSIKEAFEYVINWMNDGLEGGIIKNKDGLYRDGTSKDQQKIKLEIEIDVRVKGFKEGRAGTKRESTFGAIEYSTDDDQIKGAVSGFTDKQLEEINSNREKYIDLIMVVACNDITKGRDNEHYALSHPRFKDFRTDKTVTDTLERALEIKQMSMEFGNE